MTSKYQIKENLVKIIDAMGKSSSKAQNLRSPITSFLKMQETPAQRIYLMKDAVDDKMSVVGILKVGAKKLFAVDEVGRHLKILPLCVLDFYVHESCQRKGYGKKLFEHMLKNEDQTPAQLAYDRPSAKFKSFLKRHYNLFESVTHVSPTSQHEHDDDRKEASIKQGLALLNTEVKKDQQLPNTNTTKNSSEKHQTNNSRFAFISPIPPAAVPEKTWSQPETFAGFGKAEFREPRYGRRSMFVVTSGIDGAKFSVARNNDILMDKIDGIGV
ncbi:Alpha-tubulin N-acetyltransferase 1 [Nowakowskiella sp. JEL0407]|nr:Alpha-tubulin N-acetyltransferase 1 [Nowakowskiella sp. JEL0407]